MKLPNPSRERAGNRIDFDAVNRAALRSPVAVMRRLLPNGKIEGHEFVALNPLRADKRPGSFRVNLRSFKWADFAASDARGGDATSLVAYLEGTDQAEAARRLAQMLGVSP